MVNDSSGRIPQRSEFLGLCRWHGGRMRAALALALTACLGAIVAAQPISFTNTSARMANPSLRSGVNLAVADMNSDGLDDLVRLHIARQLQIEYQTPAGGQFILHSHGDLAGTGNEWGMAVADADSNGFNDIYAAGAYNSCKVLLANPTGTAYVQYILPGPSIFQQSCNFADMDVDGDLDIFACHDEGISSPYSNNGAGIFSHAPSMLVAASTIPSDNSGNYGTVFVDYDNDRDLDLYLSKCRLGVTDPMDGRRVNLLFQNDGFGNYTDVALAANLRVYGQSWTTDFADIDNDGDFDCLVIIHDIPSKLYENNGAGVFTEITAASGLATGLASVNLGMQCKFEDFDNDGFVDVLVTGRSGQHRLFINDRDKSFTAMTTPFATGGLGIHSAAVGDLNHDGFIDVLAGFATGYNTPSTTNPDRLFLSNGNANNYFNLQLRGPTGNRNAVGARVELRGAWGLQIREVRAGESYGITNSFTVHFGLGTATTIDSVIVRWPSGSVCTVMNPPVNTFFQLEESCQPMCTAQGPSAVVIGDASIDVDFTTIASPTAALNFEYSLDGGTTYAPCAAAATSLLANPALALAAGAHTFVWDTYADGVGIAAVETGVVVRVLVDEGGGPAVGECVTLAFDVDNTMICRGVCGDCSMDLSSPDVLDALQAANFAVGVGTPSMAQTGCCDVDSDSDVDIIDALNMAKFGVGLTVSLVCP